MSGADTPIPASIDEVTPAWMSDVLGAEVSALTPIRIGEGVGIMGDIFRTELTYAEASDAPPSVVVKLPSPHEENRTQGIALGMYEAEVRFYAELGERTGTGLPRIHRAQIVPGTADFVIVMEDLGRLEMVDQAAGMSVDQAAAAIRVLADIHAAWWDRVKTDELEWIPSMVGPRIEMVDQMLPQVHQVFAAGFAERLPDGGIELTERFSSNYLSLMQTFAARSPWTLAHQDFRVENMLFGDPTKDEVVVIDWQGIGRGPGAYDVAYILGGSMSVDLRRAHERDLVATYQQRLAANGVSGYDPETAWDDYIHANFLGGLATSVFAGGTLDLSNERGVELITMMATRHVTAALDHGGIDALEQFAQQ